MPVKIPNDLLLQITFGKFKVGEIVTEVKDINQNLGTELFIAAGTHDHITEIIGCPDLSALPKLASYCGTFAHVDMDILLHVKPFDPAVLPVNLPNISEWVWVLFSDIGLARCATLELARTNIETLIKKWPNTSIDDFAVLIGQEKQSFDKKDYVSPFTSHVDSLWDM